MKHTHVRARSGRRPGPSGLDGRRGFVRFMMVGRQRHSARPNARALRVGRHLLADAEEGDGEADGPPASRVHLDAPPRSSSGASSSSPSGPSSCGQRAAPGLRLLVPAGGHSTTPLSG